MPMQVRQNGIEIPKNFVDTEAFASTMFEQLKLAGQVQRDFLPKYFPDSQTIKWAVSFIPAEVVSGDIYDIARLDEKHIGFYVADVVGHGMPAALLTIFLKHAIVTRQTLGNSYKIYSPQEVLESLNTRMVELKLSGSQFISCCYCLLNVETLTLTISRAGHPYPILVRVGDPQRLQSEGPLLGIFDDAVFEQQSFQLQPGDKLLVYSDGAEHIIGHFEQDDRFIFEPDFSSIINEPVERLNELFTSLIQNRSVNAAEVDDITAVWLEIK
jgi:sigma-B regulation protein RsbU (phosphoserine phosphatase)